MFVNYRGLYGKMVLSTVFIYCIVCILNSEIELGLKILMFLSLYCVLQWKYSVLFFVRNFL